MKRTSRAAAAALVSALGCTTDAIQPTVPEADVAWSVVSVTSGPQYLSRGGFQEGVLEDINNHGVAVGTLRSPNQAVVYPTLSGPPTLLLPLPSGSQSQALGINDRGVIVGSSAVSGSTFAVYWPSPPGPPVQLDGGAGNSITAATDVNENGLIVGYFGGTNDLAGFWSSGGPFTRLALPGGAVGAQAHAVNDAGDIVGASTFTNSQDLRPTLWRAPAYIPQTLRVPVGFFGGILRGISNSGVIVGAVARSTCSPPCGISLTPAVWLDASSDPIVIGGAAEWIARDVNEDGTVVGGSSSAWVWSSESGLLALTSPSAVATALNDVGDVVGWHNRGTGFEPTVWGVEAGDSDGDGLADESDNCPLVANRDQSDVDSDGLGDACDPFPRDPRNDVDGDGLGSDQDNCPEVSNPDQADSNRDGIGDACGPNVAPVVSALHLPGAPIPVGTVATIGIDFTDPDGGDTHTALVEWETAHTTPGIVRGERTFDATHTFTQAGVYTVAVTVTDDSGANDRRASTLELIAYIVVFDPSGGFVTGGGSILSPAGACRTSSCTSATSGKASFGFVSKYQNGAKVPSGNTEFHFKAGDLRFSSSSYDWLVVAGARANYKGEGTINGSGRYAFLITAIDGRLDHDSPDRFRIKIWELSTGVVVYDNKMGAAEDGDDATEIESGSIVIHK